MTITRVLRDDAGQGLTEYGLILFLVAISVLAVMTTTGTSITGMIQYVMGRITT